MADRADRFCVEETSFALTATEFGSVEALLEALVECIVACRDDGHEVMCFSELQSQEIVPGISLSTLLYDPGAAAIDQTLRLAAMQAINQCVSWDEREPAPIAVHVAIGGTRIKAPTLAYAHRRFLDGATVACIPFRDGTPYVGRQTLVSGGRSVDVDFVRGPVDRLRFYRTILSNEDLVPDEFTSRARLAFPDLWFAPQFANQFRHFSQPSLAIRKDATDHLAGLNDHFQRVFREASYEPRPTYIAMAATCGVRMSMESPNTHANKKAMEERVVDVEGARVSCEWHTKLGPTDEGRIHFHPGSPDRVGGRVVIGVIKKHLL